MAVTSREITGGGESFSSRRNILRPVHLVAGTGVRAGSGRLKAMLGRTLLRESGHRLLPRLLVAHLLVVATNTVDAAADGVDLTRGGRGVELRICCHRNQSREQGWVLRAQLLAKYSRGRKVRSRTAPIPEVSPSWDHGRGKTMDEIEKAPKAAKAGPRISNGDRVSPTRPLRTERAPCEAPVLGHPPRSLSWDRRSRTRGCGITIPRSPLATPSGRGWNRRSDGCRRRRRRGD